MGDVGSGILYQTRDVVKNIFNRELGDDSFTLDLGGSGFAASMRFSMGS
jgi:hypothetical protein